MDRQAAASNEQPPPSYNETCPEQYPQPYPQPHPQSHPQPYPQPHPQSHPQPYPPPYPQQYPQPHPQSHPQPYPPGYPQPYPHETGHKTVVAVIHATDYHGNIEMQDNALPDYTHAFEDVNCFSDAVIRRAFLRKVYLTLVVQLLITVGFICAFLYWDTLREWARDTPWFTYSMMAATLVLIVVLSCFGDVRRKVPLNFIFLGLFTITEGLLLGAVTVFYSAEAVLWAVGATALVSFALSLFAMQSKWDFTAASGTIWAVCWTLVLFGLLCVILRSQYLYILYASLGTLVFSIYLVMDTQLMLGGKHKYSISPEEYIFAALNLYLDIITIFLMILQLIGLCR